MKNKNFDCVEMMHQGALRIYEETRGFTREQEMEYWRRKDKESIFRGKKQKGRPSLTKSRLLLEQVETLFRKAGPSVAARRKDFDCVEMMHQAAQTIYDETKDLTPGQQIAYWERKSDEARKEYRKIQDQAQVRKKARSG